MEFFKSTRPHIAVYTHDTFGLGHVRRCMHIIRQIAKQLPEAAILLVTGSPALHFFKNLPSNVDIVKIPTIVKTGSAESAPPHLPLGISEMTQLRTRIIRETVLAFDPDLFLVDNFPLGAQAELLPLLKDLKGTHCKTFLGLRDILDGPEVVRAEWKKQGVYRVLERYYDKILIYGVQEIFDAIKEYEIPESIACKVRFCGYLTGTDPFSEDNDRIRQELGVGGKFILATGGGGGDAYPLLSALIEASPMIDNASVVIFSGPLMGEGDRKKLKEQVKGHSNVIFRDFVHDLRPYLKAADVVVSMCGYNIASEIVYHGANAIVAPRNWRFGEHEKRKKTHEEKEQILRAQVLAESGLVHLLEPESLTSKSLLNKIDEAMSRRVSATNSAQIQVNGLEHAVNHILEWV